MSRKRTKQTPRLDDWEPLIRNRPCGSEGERLNMTQEIYRDTATVIRQLNDRRSLYDDIDLTGERLKRRIKATAALAPEAVRRFGSQAPGIFFEFEWAQINAEMLDVYNTEEVDGSILLGASLWILDRLRERGRLKEAMAYLPREGLYEVDIPDIWDACHSDEVIRGMVKLISERDDDLIPPAKRGKCPLPRDGMVPKWMLDEYTASGRNRTAPGRAPSRDRFEAVLALLDPGDVGRACARFTDLYWAFLDRYYGFRAGLAEREQVQVDCINGIVAKANVLLRRLRAQMEKRRDDARKPAGPQAPNPLLAEQPDRFAAVLSAPEQQPYARPARQMRGVCEDEPGMLFKKLCDYDEQRQRAYEELDALRKVRRDMNFAVSAGRFGQVENGPQLGDWADFAIGEPYSCCFALLYLLETGSDLPWAYFAGVGLMQLVCRALPWNHCPYSREEDEIWQEKGSALERGYISRREHRRSGKKPPEMPDWYAPEYEDRSGEADGRASLVQLLYEATGAIMPRNLQRYERAAVDLGQYGITGRKALMLEGCMLILGEAQRRSELPQELSPAEEEPAQAIPQEAQGQEAQLTREEDGAELTARLEAQAAELRRLKEENRRLRGNCSGAEREAARCRRQMEEQRSQYENDRRELIDLRELVFNLEQEDEEALQDAVEAEAMAWPYTLEQRAVVFGGHETWLKAIRERIKGARWIGRAERVQTELIRSADVVWIQPNALAHKQFYVIADECRKQKKPMRYFTNASAEIGARQMVEEDRACKSD